MIPARVNRRIPCIVVSMLVAFSSGQLSAETPDDGFVVRDPHFGEVLFHFYQQDHFTALTHLVTARSQQRVDRHSYDAELLQGGLLLSWGQHVEAGEIFERLLESADDPAVRDRTWFYLGKVRYQRGFLAEAEQALESISAPLPEALEAERYNLLARIYMDQQRFADAVALLEGWRGEAEWKAYANYNSGVALVRMGELELGARVLDKLGTMRAPTEELRGLRDRANVALGFAFLQAQLDGDALPVLQRVRLNGPFSNKALLGAGWAASSREQYRDALAAWLALSERDLLDSAVQESLLAVPYAYVQIGAEAEAAKHYARALDVYGSEVERLDTAIAEAGTGRLVNSLLENDPSSMGGWYWELDRLPGDERARYLYFTIANHRFHEALKSYRDLTALETHLTEWIGKLDAYRNMLQTREQAYAERLPVMAARVAEFDLAAMQSEFAALENATETTRATRDIVAAATTEEQAQWQRLLALESNPAWNTPAADALRAKQRVLKGRLLWTMDKEFRVRSWRQGRQLADLKHELAKAGANFADIDAATDSIPGTLAGFATRIDRLEPQLHSLLAQIGHARQTYSDFLNGIAVDELGEQKQRLQTYRAQARFALASIYDRMAANE